MLCTRMEGKGFDHIGHNHDGQGHRPKIGLTKFVNNCDKVVCGAISIMAKRELDRLK